MKLYSRHLSTALHLRLKQKKEPKKDEHTGEVVTVLRLKSHCYSIYQLPSKRLGCDWDLKQNTQGTCRALTQVTFCHTVGPLKRSTVIPLQKSTAAESLERA